VSEAQGRRALDCAFERGISWYDVAPSYGDGEAETILGKFLVGRRDRVAICTKFGILRPTISPMMRFLRPAARAVVKAFPRLRAGLVKARFNSDRAPLRAELIESSVVESLRRLRTDYLDVLALHEPSSAECVDDAILAAMRRVVEKGYVRCLSIAGAPEAIEAGTRASALFQAAQLADNLFQPAVEQLRAKLAGVASPFLITHGVFSVGAHERLSRLLVGDGGRLGALASQLGYGPPFMASELLLDYAFALNSEGVVLASMFQQAHIDLNCARASRLPRAEVSDFVRKTILGPPNHPIMRYV
jgi:aryl-alcohol dehydrogenase-like predicted oxidoreductase